MIGADRGLLLPAGTRLLHIGPHKTGTTSLQSAFHTHRREVLAQDVRYAGPNRQPMQAAHAITRKPSPYADGAAPPRSRWTDLVREVAGAKESRVIISSEGFADADGEAIRTVVDDLDRYRLHVVVTLRPLASILPSQWQQYVQGGMVLAYDAWLDAMLNQPPGKVSPSFWHRHRHHELIARWASAVGSDRVTAIVADEADRDLPLRSFEQLLGLREGTLAADADLGNRSLTLAEVETVRAFNRAFRAEGLGTQLHTKVMRFGAAEQIKRRVPGPDEPRIETPAWAVEKAGEIAREIVDGIRTSGVRVVGDLDQLAGTATPAPRRKRRGAATTVAAASTATTAAAEPAAIATASMPAAVEASAAATPWVTPDDVWATVGANAAVGILLSSGLARGAKSLAGSDAAWPDGPIDWGPPPPRARVEPLELARVSTPLLGLVLVRRLIGSGFSRLPRLPRPRRRSS